MVTVSLHEKNGKYHAVINYKDDTGKRKQKWQSTLLPVKGNKKLAMQKAEQMVNYRINNYFTTNKIRLKELQPINIQDFYTYLLNDGLSSNTVIHYHAIIHKALDYAFKMFY